ncbi:MAG: helix-turn-helix transcriptional regulator [Alphaproteobacteria bacterium]|nr:helix-turn-helix transcriptional regulator [Alphaproteobacteria bacterium]MBR6502590.1 helix-turn-helix transcriptional regulator [Clostridia bacterium]
MKKPKYRRNMRMKGVRIANGNLSQLKAAALMGFSTQYFSRVERGMIDGSVDFWRTFAATFHLSDAVAWQIMNNITGSNINGEESTNNNSEA